MRSIIKFYCADCKQVIELCPDDVIRSTLRNDFPAATGLCINCGGKIFKLLNGDDVKGDADKILDIN
jgi:NAD-dependent dihydropyrimidine dehydrogenase PreA subunit